MERQKTYSGDTSTYTWKNHVKWFQARKAKAVVWLMRKAARSLKIVLELDSAGEYLRHIGKQAKALSWLMDLGNTVCANMEKRVVAKRFILERCVHARKYESRYNEAREWLTYTAMGVVKELAVEDRAREGEWQCTANHTVKRAYQTSHKLPSLL
jgi:hypothetical protein